MSILDNLTIMDQEIIEILKEIKSEEHLDLLLPNKLSNSLKSLGLNLYEICQLNEEYFENTNGLGKTKFKYLVDFNLSINEDPSFIFLFQKYILGDVQIIPENNISDYSLAKKLFTTLEEFISIVEEKKKLSLKKLNVIEKKSFETFAEYISLYFGIADEEILNLDQIAVKYGKTTENIRSSLFYHNSRPDLVDLFLKNEVGYKIKINQDLIQEALNFIDQSIYKPFDLSQFVSYNNFLTEVQVHRMFELFDYKLEEIEFDTTNVIYTSILKKDEKVLFKSHFRVIDMVLRNGAKLSYNDLLETCLSTIKSLPNNQTNKYIIELGLNLNMFDAIIKEYFKIEKIEEDSQELYQFKWHHLSAQINKTTRILFEFGRVMSKEEIFEEFQSRESELGIEFTIESLDFLHIKATDKIHPIGKSGNWFYEENYSKEKNSLAQKVNQDIVTKFSGKVNIDQFMEYTKSKDFYKNYEISSIRANVLLCSKQAVNDSNIFIHNDFKERYPEIELKGNRNKYLGNSIIKNIVKIFENNERPIEKNELINLIILKLTEDDISIKNKSNIFQYLLKFSDLGVLTKIEENNNVYFQLDKEQLDTHDIEKLGKKQEPIYKTHIRAKAINYLKDHPKVKLSEVFEYVKDLAPVENAKTNIYRIFNDTSLFIKETIGTEVWISLDTPKLPVPQEMHVEVTEETTEVLGNNPLPIRQLFDTAELKRAIIDELLIEKNTYGLNQDIIFETYESFIEIILNNQRNSIWGRTLVQSIYENFCTKTDIYDRQICVMNLIGSYETYLKLISPLSETARVSGVVEIINSIPEIRELYYYKNQEKYKITDKQKNNFSHILNRVKYMADLYRHDRSSDELAMGNSKMMKFIVDFTALYLYTLYLVDRY